MTDFDRIRQTAEQHNLTGQTEIQKLLQIASATKNEYRLQQIHKIVKMKASQKIQSPFQTPSPVIDPRKNNLYIGKTEEGRKLHLSVEDIIHLGFFGKSQAGKTTFFKDQMIQISQKTSDTNFWAVDFNRDYRHLANRNDIELLVLPFKKLKLNPLKPPPTTPIESWQNTFAEIFADSQALLDASENFTDQQLNQLYQDRASNQLEQQFQTETRRFQEAYHRIAETGLDQVYQGRVSTGQTPDYPTLIDLEQAVKESGFHPSDPRSNYRARFLNRLRNINQNSFHTIDCVHGHRLQDMAETNVVFEMDTAKGNVAPFFVELLFAWVQDYRMHHESSSHAKLVWMRDELKNTHSKYKEQQIDSGEPVLTERFARSRNQDMSTWGADQLPTRITDAFLGNVNVLMLGPFLDHTQFQKVAESIGLMDDRYQRRAAKNLGVGEAVVKVSGQGIYKVRLPFREVVEDVTDADLVEMFSDAWQRLLHTNTSPSSGSGGELEQPAGIGKDGVSGLEEPEQPEASLTEKADRFLKDIVENPVKKATERYELFSSTGKASRAKKELMIKNLVEEIPISKEDSQIKLLDITEKGKQYLESQDIEVEWDGRGGIEHKYWQHRIRNRLEELGYAAELEHQNRDVYGLKDSDIAIEIAMGKNQREIEHIADALERGYGQIIVAARNPEIKGYVRRKAQEEDLDKDNVAFSTVVEAADMASVNELA